MNFEKIGNIAKFINGAPFKPSDWVDEGLRIIRIQNLTDPNKPYNRTLKKVDKKYLVKKGDVLVSWSATIDIFLWNDDDALLNQHIFKVNFDKSKVEKSYFIFALKDTIYDLSRMAHGSTMKHVVKGDFENHKIPLPTLSTQLHIANILTKAERLIAQRKESIRLLDEYLKSVFLEMFHTNEEAANWIEVRFEELAANKKASMRSGPFGSSLLHSEFTEIGDVKVLGIDNVVTNRFTWKKNRCITMEKYQELKRYRVFPNDVLISIMATLGRTAVVPDDIPLCINSKHLAAITLDKSLANPYFIAYAFNNHPLLIRQLTNSTIGAIMAGLNLTIIKNIKIKRPPIDLQNQFQKVFEKTEALKAQYQQSLQELENLYGSLSQKAFKGELNLKDESLLSSDELSRSMAAEPEVEYKKQLNHSSDNGFKFSL